MIPAASGRPLVTSHLHKTLYSGRGVGWILNKCWQCTAQQTPDMLVLHMSIMFEELTLRINTVSSGLVRTQNTLGKDDFSVATNNTCLKDSPKMKVKVSCDAPTSLDKGFQSEIERMVNLLLHVYMELLRKPAELADRLTH